MHAGHREWFVAQLDAEATRTRRALEHVPTGKEDWTPHPRSMALVQAHDDGVNGARAALLATTEEHLAKDWKLMMSGKVVSSDSRVDVLRDTFMHLAHHRGQLTVYLRLAGGTVPALYGPSADDARWS